MGGVSLALILPLLIIEVVLAVIAIVDIVRSEETNGPKWFWIVVSVCFSIIGPVAYFIFGRKSE